MYPEHFTDRGLRISRLAGQSRRREGIATPLQHEPNWTIGAQRSTLRPALTFRGRARLLEELCTQGYEVTARATPHTVIKKVILVMDIDDSILPEIKKPLAGACHHQWQNQERPFAVAQVCELCKLYRYKSSPTADWEYRAPIPVGSLSVE